MTTIAVAVPATPCLSTFKQAMLSLFWSGLWRVSGGEMGAGGLVFALGTILVRQIRQVR
ncbi:MAG TPA: hypothetical protein VFD70_06195 [Anaerolineae bacterium]|nr:hypothetical protein [Anaerolineae bacterium]